MESIWNLVIYFAVCSFLGWIIQAVYDLIGKRKIINSGFLYGPFVPIFGFTVLLIYFFNLYFINFPLYFKLIFYFILPTFIEYFTGLSFKKIFNVKLWDYSHQRFNLQGRISLAISTLWFLLILLQVFVLEKIIFNGINQFNEIFRIILSISLVIYFGVDLFFSTRVFYYFSKIKKEFEKYNKKIDLRKGDKKFILKMNSVSRRMKISPILKVNIKQDIVRFIEKFGKR